MPDPSDLLPPEWVDWPIEKKQLALHKIRYSWELWARPDQLPPPTAWDIWLILSGRGWGKTRTGAEWVRDKLVKNPGWRGALISPSYGAARDTQLEGESGLIGVLPPELVKKYNRTFGQLELTNGSKVFTYSGNDPEKLRGPQHHFVWHDEICAYQYPVETWDQSLLGNRLGRHPQTLITTTPRPIPLMKELVKRFKDEDPTVVLTKGSTFDNAANLAGSALRALLERYQGTHLGRQELYAELISDAPGALWTRANIDQTRWTPPKGHTGSLLDSLPSMIRIVVAIDPAVTSTKRSDETGIIVAGRGVDGRGYILEDLTMQRASPDVWAKQAITAYRRYHADRLVVEINNGGDLVANTLRTIDTNLPIKTVYASRGKQTRAEPISALYEQGKVSHCGMLADLEDQMASWVPGEGDSPDRVDALVWSLTDLMLGGGASEVFAPSYKGAGPIPRR